MIRAQLCSLGLALGAGLAVAWGGQPPAVPVDDRAFVQKAGEVNVAQAEFGRLALKQAGREDVKRYAKDLVLDHTRSNASLDRVAQELNLPVKSATSAGHREAFRKLALLRGGDFDRAFLAEMVRGHEKAVELFNYEAVHGKAPAVRRYAFESLPALRGHLRAAQTALARLGDRGKR